MHPARNWKPYVVIVGAALVFGLRVALQPAGVPFPPGSDYSDIVLAHWPNAEFVRRSLVAYGQLPLWNPNVLGGQPFAADPLAGISYPPDWLLFFLPLPLGFNLLYLAHLVWAGWGALRWLRAEGRSEAAALFGALLVMGLPKAAAHYGAGHFGLVQAVAWTPWLLLAVRRTDDTRTALRLGAVAALVFLADVRWCAYAGALTGAYWLVRVQRFERRALRLAAVAVGGFVAFGAVLWLPLAEFVRLSSRTSLTLDEASIFALGLRDLA
ncbi:MAG: hypothetical protein ACE5FI_19505, partial [Anaerolineales bacterium]